MFIFTDTPLTHPCHAHTTLNNISAYTYRLIIVSPYFALCHARGAVVMSQMFDSLSTPRSECPIVTILTYNYTHTLYHENHDENCIQMTYLATDFPHVLAGG